MFSSTPKHREQSPIESWVLDRFGGTDARRSISEHAERLVEMAGINQPPVCVIKLAKTIGVDPWPVYEFGVEGAIRVINGQIRIVLSRYNGSGRSQRGIAGRARFTYAHELGHTFFYDLKCSPPIRLAPTNCHRIEEQLCNRAASRFLVPECLLKQELADVKTLSPALFRELACRFQTSIQAISYRISESISARLAPNQIYILSANGVGFRKTGVEKPRCLICILGPALSSENLSFLQSYQGINRVRRQIHESNCPWSLEEFFQRGLHEKVGSIVEVDETVQSPAGSVFELKARHSTTQKPGLVWSEGTLTLIEKKRPVPKARNRL